MNLQERLSSLQNLLTEKVNQLNQIEALRNNLLNEILEIRGKINLLNELISQEKTEHDKGKPTTEKSLGESKPAGKDSPKHEPGKSGGKASSS